MSSKTRGTSGCSFPFTDVDECTDANPCDANGACQNTLGSFVCFCNNGFTGDGLTCTGSYVVYT